MLYVLAGVLMAFQLQAQQQTGRVVYEHTPQMIHMVGPGGPGQAPPLLHTPKFKLEVLFANNQMLRRALEDNTMNDFAGDGGGVQIRMDRAGGDDITWLNFTDGRKVEQKEFAAKQYLVSDSVRKQNWKLTGETKTLLGYACQQATTTRYSKRISMNIDNGQMVRKEITDTSQVAVWFTPAIPVSAGPDYEGQLPGLILQIDINGNTTFKALEVSPTADVAAIKEPKKGKKITADEFNNERKKIMEEMHRNGPRRIGHGG